MAKQQLGRVVKQYIEEGLTTIDTATYVIRHNNKLRTTHNLACVANISKHLSILTYFDRAMEKPNFPLDIDALISQIEISAFQVQSSTLSLSQNCLKDNR